MRKGFSLLFVVLMTTTMFAIAEQNTTMGENLENPEVSDPGIVAGTGNCFKVTNSTYLNITLCSNEVVHVALKSFPGIVSYAIRNETSASSTGISLSGFESGKTYYRHEDGHLMEEFVPDGKENYSYTQDISLPHHVFIREDTSTYFIRDDATGGDCDSIGLWQWSTKTCRLQQDVYETIVMDDDGITLDGANHIIYGPYVGFAQYGVYAAGRTGITIKDVVVREDPFAAIYLFNSNDNIITNNIIKGNFGMQMFTGIWLDQSDYNVVSDNSVWGASDAILLWSSNDNAISDNTISRTLVAIGLYDRSFSNDMLSNWIYVCDLGGVFGLGISLIGSDYSIINGNRITNPNLDGIALSRSDVNTVTSNTVSYAKRGIKLHDSNNNNVDYNTITHSEVAIDIDPATGNTISGNNLMFNYIGLSFHLSSGNFIFHNNLFDNTIPIQSFESENTWDDSSGEGTYWDDYEGEDLDGDGIGDTLLPHNGVDWFPLIDPWFPTQVDAVQMLKRYIEEQIDHNAKKGLIAQLDSVESALANGNENAAIKILNAFIKHVDGLLKSGILKEEQAEFLTFSAENIISMIEGS